MLWCSLCTILSFNFLLLQVKSTVRSVPRDVGAECFQLALLFLTQAFPNLRGEYTLRMLLDITTLLDVMLTLSHCIARSIVAMS